MSLPPPISVVFVHDATIRRELSASLPSYSPRICPAQWARWHETGFTDCCEPECGCPESQFTQAEVDAFRDQLTTKYIKEFEESVATLQRVQTNACARTVANKMWKVACCSQRGRIYIEEMRNRLQASIDRDEAVKQLD